METDTAASAAATGEQWQKHNLASVRALYSSQAQQVVTYSQASIALESPTSVVVTALAKQRDMERKVYRVFLRSFGLTLNSSPAASPLKPSWSSPFPADASDVTLLSPSPSGRKQFILRKVTAPAGGGKAPSAAGAKPLQYIEIWSASSLLHCIPTEGKHEGVFKTDDEFGTVCWSHDESAVVYMAEASQKLTSLWDSAADASQPPPPSYKFEHAQDWGEGYSKRGRPVPVLVNFSPDSAPAVTVLDFALTSLPRYGLSYTPAGALWIPSSLGQLPANDAFLGYFVFVAYSEAGYRGKRLGLRFCNNRDSVLAIVPVFASKEATAAFGNVAPIVLSRPGFNARSPRFHEKTKTLVYLENDVGSAHNACSRLISASLPLDVADAAGWDRWAATHRVVVDTVSVPPLINPAAYDKSVSAETKYAVAPLLGSPSLSLASSWDSLGFAGLYVNQLPERCFHGTDWLVTDTAVGSARHVLTVQLSTGRVVPLTRRAKCAQSELDLAEGCWSVADVDGDSGLVLASFSAPAISAGLWMTQLATAHLDASDTLAWTCVTSPAPRQSLVQAGVKTTMLRFLHTPTGAPWDAAVLYGDDASLPPVGSRPLVVYPHGGPHSVFPLDGNPLYSTFARLGFVLVLVNYRGSLGFGQASVDNLLGHIGKSDVEDVYAATSAAIASGHGAQSRVVAFGGSHGGFLSVHMVGQYPDLYKVCVVRNPVVHIPLMVADTDIPDWCFAESGIARASSLLGQPEGSASARGALFAHSDPTSLFEPTDLQLTAMRAQSPIAYVEHIKAPTLIVLGANDRRVPPSQGMGLHFALKARGVATRLLVYPDNGHAIAEIEAESDFFLHSLSWIEANLA